MKDQEGIIFELPLDCTIEKYTSINSLRNGLSISPKNSFYYGAAGISYMFLRISELTEDYSLIQYAKAWSNIASSKIIDSLAFSSPLLIDSSDNISHLNSLYFGMGGVHCVGALVAMRCNDQEGANQAIEKFTDVSLQIGSKIDLTTGVAGNLLGYSLMLEAAKNMNSESLPLLKLHGDATANRLWGIIEDFTDISECTSLRELGIAHGWAGIIYAITKWSKISGFPIPNTFEKRINQLLKIGKISDLEYRWHVSNNTTTVLNNWCNGTTGYVFLFLLIYDLTNDPRYKAIAENCGEYILKTYNTRTNSSLCCGLAGQVYVFLELYKVSGNQKWLDVANSTYSSIIIKAEPSYFPDSLFSGKTGIILLGHDISNPPRARFPFF